MHKIKPFFSKLLFARTFYHRQKKLRQGLKDNLENKWFLQPMVLRKQGTCGKIEAIFISYSLTKNHLKMSQSPPPEIQIPEITRGNGGNLKIYSHRK